MDLNLEKLDADMRPFFEQAYATFRERITCDEAVRNRKPFVGPGRNTTPQPMPKMTVELAFEQLIRCRARVARNDKPATAKDIEYIWQEYHASRYHYVPEQYPFPAQELADLKLSLHVFQDIFHSVKDMKAARPTQRRAATEKYPKRPMSFGEILNSCKAEAVLPIEHAPYNMIVKTAETFAGKIKKDVKKLAEAEDYLQSKGYLVCGVDEEKLREMQSIEKNDRLYPRTYL